MIILLMGPQGSGKGTQGEMLSKELGVPLLGTGALLREEIATGSDLGREISKIIDAGNLVPPDLATRTIAERLKHKDAQNGALIDGYPRDKDQLSMMFQHFTPDLVIAIEISDETAVDRLGGRWMCPDGHIWNMITNMPSEPGRCDNDGKELYQRADDKEDAIRRRLAIYHKDTAPLMAELVEKGVRIARIDGAGSIEEVHDKIKSIVE